MSMNWGRWFQDAVVNLLAGYTLYVHLYSEPSASDGTGGTPYPGAAPKPVTFATANSSSEGAGQTSNTADLAWPSMLAGTIKGLVIGTGSVAGSPGNVVAYDPDLAIDIPAMENFTLKGRVTTGARGKLQVEL